MVEGFGSDTVLGNISLERLGLVICMVIGPSGMANLFKLCYMMGEFV